MFKGSSLQLAAIRGSSSTFLGVHLFTLLHYSSSVFVFAWANTARKTIVPVCLGGQVPPRWRDSGGKRVVCGTASGKQCFTHPTAAVLRSLNNRVFTDAGGVAWQHMGQRARAEGGDHCTWPWGRECPPLEQLVTWMPNKAQSGSNSDSC